MTVPKVTSQDLHGSLYEVARAAMNRLSSGTLNAVLVQLLDDGKLSLTDLLWAYETLQKERSDKAAETIASLSTHLAGNVKAIPKTHKRRTLAAQALINSGQFNDAPIYAELVEMVADDAGR